MSYPWRERSGVSNNREGRNTRLTRILFKSYEDLDLKKAESGLPGMQISWSLQEKSQLPEVMRIVLKETWLTWRWVETNVWILGSLLAMALVDGAPQIYSDNIDCNISPVGYARHPSIGLQPEVQKVLARSMGADTLGTLMSLFWFCLGLGVSTGIWWKTYQKVEEKVEEGPRSREIVVPEPAPTTPTTPTIPTTPTTPITPVTPTSSLKTRTSIIGMPKEYTLKEIQDMTENFKKELGRGGQGTVFLATLPEEPRRQAAVKSLKKADTLLVANPENRSQEVLEKEFWSELNTIWRLNHKSLVALLGYCIEGDELFLVYELMVKGSLDEHLHSNGDRDEEGVSIYLDWKARMRCAVEVARGLEYLHSQANPTLVHRDIKPANILFDDDMQAKIADFGLSKSLPPGHDVTATTRVRGTHGYVDPLYLVNGQARDKCDVYSFGVVLLELITGRRAIQQRMPLLTWCKEFLNADVPVMKRVLLPKMVDSRIPSTDYSYEQLVEVVKIAKACVEENQDMRPSMRDVVVGLHNADCKDYSSSDVSLEGPMDFSSNGSFNGGSMDLQVGFVRSGSGFPTYEIKGNTILVKCAIGNSKVQLRCKIWPTPKNFGLNKIEATLNGAFLWKKGLWWYNAKSSREFTIDDDVRITAEWHVALRTSTMWLKETDPRRNQGPFCVEYLALKDEKGTPLVEYSGDRTPWPIEKLETEGSKSESGSGSGSGSTERRRTRRFRRSSMTRMCASPR